MASVVDLWRAIDPAARLLGGDAAALQRPVRGAERTRSAPPLLPSSIDGALLVADIQPFGSLEALLSALVGSGLSPAALLLHGPSSGSERVEGSVPVLASAEAGSVLLERAGTYLADEPDWLERLGLDIRLASAEAALADPEVAAPAGVVSARLRRGVAVAADGALRSLHPREAGRALAARFAALHGRLLASGAASPAQLARRTRDGLYLLERRIHPGATAWLFDDLPFAAVDEVALEAVAVTLRALLRRRPGATAAGPARELARPARQVEPEPSGPAADPITATILAVARHNGRIAPAARELGLHRNTVLYRLRRADAERGLDPRRPQDALRILRESERTG